MRRFAAALIVASSSFLPLVATAGDKTPNPNPVSPIPEPAAILAFAVGAAVVYGVVRRRRQD